MRSCRATESHGELHDLQRWSPDCHQSLYFLENVSHQSSVGGCGMSFVSCWSLVVIGCFLFVVYLGAYWLFSVSVFARLLFNALFLCGFS